MKSLLPSASLRFLTALLCGLVLGAALARAGDPPGALVQTLAVPAGLRTSEVRRIIERSAIERGWTVVKADGDRVNLKLVDRGYEGNLALDYSPTEIRIVSDSFRIDRAGQRTKPAIPASWFKFLAKDLQKDLGLAALAKS